jgi:hypothetical protein
VHEADHREGNAEHEPRRRGTETDCRGGRPDEKHNADNGEQDRAESIRFGVKG